MKITNLATHVINMPLKFREDLAMVRRNIDLELLVRLEVAQRTTTVWTALQSLLFELRNGAGRGWHGAAYDSPGSEGSGADVYRHLSRRRFSLVGCRQDVAHNPGDPP